MKQLNNQQVITFLNQLIVKIDNSFAKRIDDPKTSMKKVECLEAHSTKMTSEIQNVISYITLYN